ncbi:hypothetical protein [Dyadobacter sp. MSC1_007]|jgi:hypothetical protein|uniref:hypothetical protein n=1 Tax=Dyadobacter sp. MSC1_007 TaxID=2909264 RepID=UPI00202F1452|nr:hypothetical protein [Dyadobacter sp. MSC1_007]
MIRPDMTIPENATKSPALHPARIIGEYATTEELVKAMKADLVKTLKCLDLSAINEQLNK